MQNYSDRQYVELFHLLFLDQLGRKLDKHLYALKGGCNLRFYFKSIRYSEDIDLDAKIIAKETLLKKVNSILDAQPFKQILRSHKIEIINYSTPKQTETTQRWKIILKTDSTLEINTKIEFSRREFAHEILFETIDPFLLYNYKLTPIMATHYHLNIAIDQKISALIHRTQTQARDMFDLHHLIAISKPKTTQNQLAKFDKNLALANMKSISFADFKSQVVAFLPIEYKTHYESKQVWDQMLLEISNFFEKY